MDRLGVLNVTGQGVLVLFNSTNYAVWSSNVSRIAQNPVVNTSMSLAECRNMCLFKLLVCGLCKFRY